MAGIYISYPFCAQKCTYCNFASGVFPREVEAQYMAALREEVRRHQWRWIPETLYLGGGTPSSMDQADFESLSRILPAVPFREATLEASPGTITAEKVRFWTGAGINRVSLGVQSFVRGEIARSGRKHTAESVAADVETLRSGGISNINIDLIAGLAGQTEAGWRESLEWVRRLNPPHVSVYMLEIDSDSRLGQEMLLGGVRYGAPDAPSEELTADLYEMAVGELARMGIHRYEISNFARAGMESVHNMKYWRLEPYAGFGADAHSFDAGMRWQNAESPGDYVLRMQNGGPAAVESHEANAREEKFFVGLRLSEGVRPSAEEWREFAEPIQRFVDDGLLETRGEMLQLTSRGVLFSNEVFQEFLHL
ncbi:MAG: radical SAM family heme chaperone HemW [Bryobacteraceae bacterium]